MTLSLTSTFSLVGATYDPVIGCVNGIFYAFSDNTRGRISICNDSSPYPSEGSQFLADLEILQEIYVSDDGFRNTPNGRTGNHGIRSEDKTE